MNDLEGIDNLVKVLRETGALEPRHLIYTYYVHPETNRDYVVLSDIGSKIESPPNPIVAYDLLEGEYIVLEPADEALTQNELEEFKEYVKSFIENIGNCVVCGNKILVPIDKDRKLVLICEDCKNDRSYL